MSDREGEGGKERERAESPWEDCPTFIFVDKSPVALWDVFLAVCKAFRAITICTECFFSHLPLFIKCKSSREEKKNTGKSF